MNGKADAILSAIKLNAHGLADAESPAEAIVYADIIFTLKNDLKDELRESNDGMEENENELHF